MTGQDREELARVIPLPTLRVALGTLAQQRAQAERAPADRAAESLDRRVGEGWTELPSSAGRPALRVEALLECGPTAVTPSTKAEVALTRAARVVAAARVTLGLLEGQAELLSEALGTDLGDADLQQLHEIAMATVALSTVPRPAPAWGSVAGADAASTVLELAEPVLRDAGQAHRELYRGFTERVWEIPVARLRAASRRWRVLARRRAGHELRQVSRTTSLPKGLDRAIQVVLDAHATRARLAPLRPLLAHHLGVLDRGPLTDIDGALESLAAVQDLQRALDEHQDDVHLERLLLADAFRSAEVARPASLVSSTLTAWSGDVAAAHGTRWPLATTVDELRRWVEDVQRDLPRVTEGWDAYRPIGPPSATLREVVDALVLRERFAELTAAPTVAEGDQPGPPAMRDWGVS